MKKLSKKTLWICVAIALVIAIILIYLCSQVKGDWTNLIIVLLTIDFIFLTIVIQIASFKSFTYKMKMKDYNQKDYNGNYEEFEQLLLQKGYKKRVVPYGFSFLKIKNKVAYKAVLVNDFVKYFNEESGETTSTPNKELEKCDRFVAVEIFKEIDEQNLIKLTDYTLQGKNVYYTALLNQGENTLKCLNYIEPNEYFKEPLSNLYNDLNVVEINQN